MQFVGAVKKVSKCCNFFFQKRFLFPTTKLQNILTAFDLVGPTTAFQLISKDAALATIQRHCLPRQELNNTARLGITQSFTEEIRIVV